MRGCCMETLRVWFRGGRFRLLCCWRRQAAMGRKAAMAIAVAMTVVGC